MECPGCAFESPPGLRFCGRCGERLPAGCSACGFENPDGFRFCGECGAALAGSADAKAHAPVPGSESGREAVRSPRDYTPGHLADKILRSKSALEGERKQVTVLFADVQGSMELAQQLDPEQWHAILDRFFEILADGVHRFEGTVNQYTGDGIMALFGAPIAHEDHPRRACYAALQLRDEIARYATEVKRQYGIGFSTRMGIHSGEVIVGKIGDDLRMDYTAQGYTVGLAQRMETLASPDTCYLTDATAQQVEGYFELEDLGEFPVKGASQPVRAHRLVGPGSAHTRFDISLARGLTRFVGRDADMATLEAALAESQAGNGQVVGIVAEAGTGKSRLSFEFTERCRVKGITVNQGAAIAHGRDIPYLPMLQVFRGYYGVEEQDDDRRVREKIAGRMLLLDEAFREVLPVLFEFFGVPDPDKPMPRMDPEAKQRQLFSVLRRIVQGADGDARSTRFITMIEDLHWLDAASEAFLEQWVDALAGSASFLLVNFRPEYRADWMQKSYYRQLPLAPLGPDAIRDLLRDLLGDDPSTRGLAEAIHQRTGGNPFFCEEVVQSLIESRQLEGERGAYRLETSVERLEVPASVQSVLAARIDRLPEREKQVLQAAAVIGKEFSEPILRAAAELPDVDLRGALAALKAGEFVFEQSLYPVAEYAFKHPLTQEVALHSQLAERRRRRHASVARAIEEAHPGKLDEVAALLAHHWEESGEAFTAARWHRRAAEWVSQSDPMQGVRHHRRVLTLTEALPASEARDALRLDTSTVLLGQGGWRVGLSEDEAEAIFVEGRELATRMGHSDAIIKLLVGYGATLGFLGDIRRYLELTREAVSVIDETTSAGTAGSALAPGFGYAAFLNGQLQAARESTLRAVELTRGDPELGNETLGFSIWGQALQGAAEYAYNQGDFAAATPLIEEAIEVCTQHQLTEALAWGLGVSVEMAFFKGEGGAGSASERALRQGVEAVQMAERSGSPFSRSHALRALGVAQLLAGNHAESITAFEQALTISREQSGREQASRNLAYLSQAHLEAGDPGVARETAALAIAAAQEQGARFFEALAQLALSRALRAERGGEAATAIEAALDAADARIEETGGRVIAPPVREERARLATLRGDAARAEALLREAAALYTEIGAEAHSRRLAEEIG